MTTEVDLAELLGSGSYAPTSILDRPLVATVFSDAGAGSKDQRSTSLRSLAAQLPQVQAGAKAQLPWIKLATFGDLRTTKGSLRHNANLMTVSGVEGDYDGGLISPAEAAALLRAADIAALVYSSPSHTADAPRWRVLAPLFDAAPAAERERLCARLNGALGGILAPESFNGSQAYYFGQVEGRPAPIVELVDGRPLDAADELDAGALGRDGESYAPAAPSLTEGQTADGPGPARVAAALAVIPVAAADGLDGRDLWLRIGMAVHSATDGDEAGFELWDAWSQPGAKYNARDQRANWRSFGRRERGRHIGAGTLFEIAKGYGFDPFEPSPDLLREWLDALPTLDALPAVPARSSGLRFLSAADCENEQPRGYVVKGLIAPEDVGCIYGAPGAGKSLIAPHIGYMVAQGRPAFGMRSKAGGVLYIAPEDPRGIKERVRALRIRHGDAERFMIGEGVSDLLTSGSADVQELRAQVAARRPALIFIDTLAMAFPGLEENSAEGMGRVVAVARSLTKPSGAAVVLVHHDTKAQTPTPRGHSLLNGALDFALQLSPKDDSGIVRGRLNKNRNGPCDRDLAFRIATETLGTDEDGDAITAALVAELAPGTAPRGVKLSLSEHAAKRALDVLQSVGSDPVSEDEWRAACIDGRGVSGSDDRESRRRATARAIQALVQKGVVAIRDGRIYPDNVPLGDVDDLEP